MSNSKVAGLMACLIVSASMACSGIESQTASDSREASKSQIQNDVTSESKSFAAVASAARCTLEDFMKLCNTFPDVPDDGFRKRSDSPYEPVGNGGLCNAACRGQQGLSRFYWQPDLPNLDKVCAELTKCSKGLPYTIPTKKVPAKT